MLGKHFYNESIRRTIIGFGTLFNNIELQRNDKEGNVVQTVKVPLAYGPAEKFLARVEADPNLDNRRATQIQLPRISFEMTTISYDSSRKMSPVQLCQSPKSGDTQKTYSHYLPVPYNLDFQLSIISKNNDDAVQILEQILPYFQPHFSITINMLNQTNEYKDIPIVLTNIGIQDDYEGDFTVRRTLIHTLNFTAKSYIYGPVTTPEIIKKVNVDIGTAIGANRYVRYSATPKALQDYNQDGTNILSTSVNVNSNTITLTNHGFVTGDLVTYRVGESSTAIGGLTTLQEYYVIRIDSDNFRLSISKSHASNGYSIDLTSIGTGSNHKFSVVNTLDDAFVEPDDDFGFNEMWTSQ